MYLQQTLFDEPVREPDLNSYDRVIVMLSAGKDSLASLLVLLDRGVPRDRIILYHQRIDGEPGAEPFLDWPCTDKYIELVGRHFGLPVHFQWRRGGFRAELYRENDIPQPVEFNHDGRHGFVPVTRAQPNTRRKFPALSADLSRRWCSATLKSDVARRAIAHDPTLQGTLGNPKRLLLIGGERWEESPARSRYAAFERHPTWSRSRQADLWRPVIGFSERQVWDIIRRYRLLPHPSYLIGFNRCSCVGCVFNGADHWAMLQKMAPDRFERIAQAEDELGFTIRQGISIREQAEQGSLNRMPDDWEQYRRWAFEPETLTSLDWEWPDGWYPAGAFRGYAGGSP